MILVVDDQPSACEILKKLFRHVGVPAECHTSGEDALEFMRAVRPTVVILDNMMPGMSGLDVFREMKDDKHLRDIPVIFFSAADTDDKERALEMGAAGWLTKGSVGWVDLFGKVLELDHNIIN